MHRRLPVWLKILAVAALTVTIYSLSWHFSPSDHATIAMEKEAIEARALEKGVREARARVASRIGNKLEDFTTSEAVPLGPPPQPRKMDDDRPPPQRIDGLWALQTVVDRYVGELRKAALVLGAPKQVELKQSFPARATLSFDQSPAELIAEAEKDFANVVPLVVRSGPVMEATLVGSAGLAITAIGGASRVVPSVGTTDWEWIVDAKEAGSQILTLELAVSIPGTGRYSIKTQRTTIVVAVSVASRAQEFFRENWKWLWTTLLLPIGLWIRARWSSEKPKPTPSRPWRKKTAT